MRRCRRSTQCAGYAYERDLSILKYVRYLLAPTTGHRNCLGILCDANRMQSCQIVHFRFRRYRFRQLPRPIDAGSVRRRQSANGSQLTGGNHARRQLSDSAETGAHNTPAPLIRRRASASWRKPSRPQSSTGTGFPTPALLLSPFRRAACSSQRADDILCIQGGCESAAWP